MQLCYIIASCLNMLIVYKPGRLDGSSTFMDFLLPENNLVCRDFEAYNTTVFNMSWRLYTPCVPSLHECNTAIISKRLLAHRIPNCVACLNHPFCEFSDCNMHAI